MDKWISSLVYELERLRLDNEVFSKEDGRRVW